ncbi:MAG: PolC-type DNA polymerase III [Lachnospiraceae bacterium]|nr:PolC-type DNA polymerase III [Lachnospiraceae bacterium]
MQRFAQVFPKIKLINEVKLAFDEGEIEKIAENRQKTKVRVYVKFKHLLAHKEVLYLQRQIHKHYFPKKEEVFIVESFDLSTQYTPEILLTEYESSIVEELSSCHSPFLGITFESAEKHFDEDGALHIKVKGAPIRKEFEDELEEALRVFLCKRSGFSFDIVFDEPDESEKKSTFQKNKDIEDANRLNQVKARLGMATEEKSVTEENEDVSSETKEAREPETKEPKKEADKSKKPEAPQRKPRGLMDYENAKNSGIEGLLLGRLIEEDAVAMIDLDTETNSVVLRGKVIFYEEKRTRSEKNMVRFDITDFTDSVSCKAFPPDEFIDDFRATVKRGNFLKIEGAFAYNAYDKTMEIFPVRSIQKIADFTENEKRMDISAEKRVELHCHTNMSDMDAVTDVADIIKCAKEWGHKAIAITDHGDVQAFTGAFHAIKPGEDFKILYGVEGYFADDTKDVVTNAKGQPIADTTYVVFDLETTGFNPHKNKIIEFGAVKVRNGNIIDRYSAFVNPKVPIPLRVEQLTHIRDDMVINEPEIDVRLPEFLEFIEGCVLVAHNAEFDVSYVEENARLLGLPFSYTYMDTMAMARMVLPLQKKFTLDAIAKSLKIPLENHHRAVDDAECTALVFIKLMSMISDLGATTLDEINSKAKEDSTNAAKLHTHHGIVIAKNDLGRVNLYRLISESHLNYFYRRPVMPKSLIEKYRDGLILGSACCEGELFDAILQGRNPEEIARIVNFYDYLEIQPVGNDMFMIDEEKYPIDSVEDIRDINREIVRLGKEYNKPVCATCDVHFLNPEDEIYRRIIMAGKGFDDADRQPPLYLHTTKEMLEEFSYLGEEKAYEVVVTNTNLIADMCERIAPVRPDKCPPVIDKSDEMLRTICYNKAHAIYGDELPKVVEERLSRELNSIISNGYAVMYIIAQKLVWKSNEDGYLVGSRGSVGSSFAATMAGITEVNPLAPHYYCKKCHYSDFDSEEVKAYSGASGCDMPDKKCPNCGHELEKAGFDIPFETFLGFKGNKEPDIDLNFSGEYQAKAHQYTEVIFGEGQTFKAGTVGTLADKTAYGYVKNYLAERNIVKREAEINRIVAGCTGIHRTTGQHPGGIIVLPLGEDINTFTPIQNPANKAESGIITTHFDYHSIDNNLLKLDILGHDDPTMIRLLEDLTGLDATTIPLDDPIVMKLFQDTTSIGVTPSDIGGAQTGSRGIPEFGTDNAINTLVETKPQSFSDLIRISGLSHGTNVYGGNAQTLIQNGTATISECICTRDDIMTYLISKGIENERAFKIMEAVRKGMVAKKKCGDWPEWRQDIVDHGVPDWYLWSCERIEYMFPKAHAAAYVMMAWRIAYCKVYYPLAYYAAYFSIRATNFNYELMCAGVEKLRMYIKIYGDKESGKVDGGLSAKDKGTLSDMKSVEEFYARGLEFCPIDLNVVQARRFTIVDGKLMPSLISFDGLGENAADAIVDAVKDGPFLSLQDFKTRTKTPQKIVDLMVELGILSNLPETNQISLFDSLF